MRLAPVIAAAIALLPLDAQEASDVLRRTAATYRGAGSYSLEGTDVLEQVVRGKERTTRREFRASRLRGSMRVDFADGGIRLTDGHSEWNYNPQSKQYTRKPVPWDSRGRRVLNDFFFNYEGIADFVKSAGFLSPPGKDGFLIEVTYELPGGVAAEAIKTYWIDRERYVVLRETSHPAAIVEPPTAGPVRFTRTVSFQKVTLEAPLEPALFTPPPEGSPLSGTAPDFALPDLAGAPVALRDLRGKTVVLYFWATWCGTCRAEMAEIEALGQKYRDRGLVVLGINDEDPEIASAYLRSHGHRLHSLVDRWQDVYKKYDVGEIPAVIVIGKDGRIESVSGYGQEAALRAGLRKAGVE